MVRQKHRRGYSTALLIALLSLSPLLGVGKVSSSSTGAREAGPAGVENRASVFAGRKRLSASTILRRMRARLQTIRTYQATGAGKNIYSGDERLRGQVKFALYFARPRSMRLEWIIKDEADKNILWSNGEKIGINVNTRGLDKAKDLKGGLSTASVVSSNIPFLIANLLIQDDSKVDWVVSLKQLRLHKDEVIDGEDCYVVSGVYSTDPLMSLKLWVGKKDYLLRRYEKRLQDSQENGGFTSLVEETYSNIRVDAEIPRSVFDGQPPDILKEQESTATLSTSR